MIYCTGCMVLRSVGYQSVPLAGVPFDERRYVVTNEVQPQPAE